MRFDLLPQQPRHIAAKKRIKRTLFSTETHAHPAIDIHGDHATGVNQKGRR